MPVKIKAELRKYQQDGVNWLAFLAKYQLHGILCDGESDFIVVGRQNNANFRYGPWEDFAVNLYTLEQALRASEKVQRDAITRRRPSTFTHHLSSYLDWALVLRDPQVRR